MYTLEFLRRWPNTGRNRSPTPQIFQVDDDNVTVRLSTASRMEWMMVTIGRDCWGHWSMARRRFWRLEVQFCVNKTVTARSGTVLWLLKCDWGLRHLRPRDVVRKKLPKKCPHIAWLSHANQRHRRFKEIHLASQRQWWWTWHHQVTTDWHKNWYLK